MMTEEEIKEFLAGKGSRKAVVKKVQFQPLKPVAPGKPSLNGMSKLEDVDVIISAELGRKQLTVREILKLAVGSVVELDKLVGEPVDLKINNQVFARGEMMVYGDNFEARISSIIPVPTPGRDRG